MVHADSALLPSDLKSKMNFYTHLQTQLSSLLSGQRSWVTNLSNASSILYHSLNAWRGAQHDDDDVTGGKHLNWAGFYLLSGILPEAGRQELLTIKKKKVPTLVLGPFHGMPACQAIPSIPGKGVCADGSSLIPPRAIRVDDCDAYPGHIACDSLSRSELVIPLVVPLSKLSHRELVQRARQQPDSVDEAVTAWSGRGDGDEIIVGLLDIDCVDERGFDDEDQKGLEECVRIIQESCDW